MPHYWLMKSEPDCFSIQDLEAAPCKTSMWDGVRNYQARNFLRDQMQIGDGILFYHSNVKEPAIVGTARVTSRPYPDPTAFDPSSEHFDPKSSLRNPRWFVVNVQHVLTFPSPLTRDFLKTHPVLCTMDVLKKGSRLSVLPVTEAQWKAIEMLCCADG